MLAQAEGSIHISQISGDRAGGSWNKGEELTERETEACEMIKRGKKMQDLMVTG